MKSQILSLELCKKFKKLGIELKTKLSCVDPKDEVAYLCDTDKITDTLKEYSYPAPVASELIDIISKRPEFGSDALIMLPIDEVGKLIIQLKENKLI